MPPFAPSSLLYSLTNVHSGNAVRCLATHSPPGCDGLMMTTAAALQASLPFVCSAIEVINAIIGYAGRAYVCTSYRHTGTVVITEEASWDVKMLRVDWPERGVDGLFVAGGRSCWAILLCFQWLITHILYILYLCSISHQTCKHSDIQWRQNNVLELKIWSMAPKCIRCVKHSFSAGCFNFVPNKAHLFVRQTKFPIRASQ